jgi:hypothetical protein
MKMSTTKRMMKGKRVADQQSEQQTIPAMSTWFPWHSHVWQWRPTDRDKPI